MLVLRRAEVSRSRLARLVGVDKSVVSRWASSASQPSEPNLEALTHALAPMVPGLSLWDWQLPWDAFVRKIGGEEDASLDPDGATLTTSDALMMRSFASFARDIDREAPIYSGFYRTYNRASTNDGQIRRRALMMWREGPRFLFRAGGGPFDIEGRVFVLRGKLFLFGEMARFDGVSLSILNGTLLPTPRYLTGISTGLGFDALQTPTAVVAVLEFVSRLSDDADENAARWRALCEEAAALADAGEGPNALEPEISAALDARVGVPGRDGAVDWLLRAPVTRSPG